MTNPFLRAALVTATLLVTAVFKLASQTTAAPQTPPATGIDRFVGAPNHRVRVHIAGAGSSTVVLISGQGGGLHDWDDVDTSIARFARVISYDRSGLGKSDPGAEPRSVGRMASELRDMLDAIDVHGPVILVGHSLGGPIAEIYAERHPNDVSAILLVDPALETFNAAAERLPQFQSALANQQRQRTQGPLEPRAEAIGLDSSRADMRRMGQMPRIPITMLIAGRHASPVRTSLDSLRHDAIESLWREKHIEWIAAQPLGASVLDETSGHYIQYDDPSLVVDALRNLIRRAGSPRASTVATVAARAPSCDVAPLDSVALVALPGQPFVTIPSVDGCWAFASLVNPTNGWPGGLALLRNMEGDLHLERVLPLASGPLGIAMTHDGKLLIAPRGNDIDFIDVERLMIGRPDAILGTITESGNLARDYAAVTRDDRYVFVANESDSSVTVVDLTKARANHFDATSVIGHIPTGRAPVALVFSNDDKYLYLTAQQAPGELHWPLDCRPQGSTDPNAKPDHSPGAIMVVDVARAVRDPARSVVSVVRAGCNPVRLALSPAGDVAYVTARTDNALLAFDVSKLVGDTAHALIGAVPVGTAPVGLAVSADGHFVFVTNSSRFAQSQGGQSVTVIDARRIRDGASAVAGAIPAGVFPRGVQVANGGQALFISNFGSSTIEVVDLTRLPPMRP